MFFLLLAALYVLAPGHPTLPFAGVPIGQSGITALVALSLLAGAFKHRRVPRAASAAMLALIVVKLVAWTFVPEPGWLAYYYPHPAFEGAAERSIDYRSVTATRIDRRLEFLDTSFPVHFFNNERFNYGFRREYTEPFSARWIGNLHLNTPLTLQVVIRARGAATLLVDEREIGSERVDLSVGPHRLEARYSKPANTEGMFELRGSTPADDGLLGRVVPTLREPARLVTTTLTIFAIVAHLLALGLVVRVSRPLVASWFADVRRELAVERAAGLLRLLRPAIVVGLTAEGLWKSRHLVAHVWTLTGGDDWMMFEYNAREIVLNGILMTEGKPLGEGTAYFLYPGYSYFTALVHVVTGESLAGVILMNFVMLALATVFVLRLARLLVPAPAALLAVLWLLLLEQADFVRYYTVTLLSENLFFATTAGAVLGFTSYVVDGRVRRALEGGLWGGAAAVTRPSMMLFLPFALALTAIAAWRRQSVRGALAVAGALATWMLVVSPITFRNYLVSGEPILITSGQAKSFIDYNMPPENQRFYLDMYDGSLTSAAIAIGWMLAQQPQAVLGATAHKIGFSLGMVHWAQGMKPHPELLVTSILYFASFVFVPAARSLAAMPLHLFVLTHLAAGTLSLPWIYGYRIILPMYPLMTIFAMAVPPRVLLATRFEHARAT